MKSTNFLLYCTKRSCSQIKPQLKVEIEDGRSLVLDLFFILEKVNFKKHVKGNYICFLVEKKC